MEDRVTLTSGEISELENSVDPAHRRNPSCWFMFNDSTFKAVRALKGLSYDQTIAALAEIFKDDTGENAS